MKRLILSSVWLTVFGIQLSAQHKMFTNAMLDDFIPKMPRLIYASSLEKSSVRIDKPVIDSVAIKHWITLENNKVAISNDGHYFMYNILNQPYQSNTLVIQAVTGSWKKELQGVDNGFFTDDNKQFIYLEKNTLYFLSLEGKDLSGINNVAKFNLFENDKGHYLFYQLRDQKDQLIIRDIQTGKEQLFQNVIEYKYDKNTNNLILKKQGGHPEEYLTTLQWVNISDGQSKEIWSSKKGLQLMEYTTDWANRQLTMLISDTSNISSNPVYSIWYYREGMNHPIMVVNDETPGIDADLILAEISSPGFTKDGRYLCFSLKEKEQPKAVPNAVKVDVWTYHDTIIQSMQLLKMANGEEKIYQAVVPTQKLVSELPEKIVQLLQNNDEPAIEYAQNISGDFFLVREKLGGDRFWERKIIYRLVSMKDGSRKVLYTSKEETQFWLSPSGHYLVHFNDDHQYYSYDLRNGKKKNISKDVKSNLNLGNPYYLGYDTTRAAGVGGWIENEDYVLVYDHYDIWKLDLKGIEQPLNVTRGYGAKHNFVIRIVQQGSQFKNDDTILLSIFNQYNKYNGIYQVALKNHRSINEPIAGPHSIFYYGSINQAATDIFNDFQPPVKSKESNVWIIRRESVNEAPNYFATEDFITYNPLTDFQPQKKYNWFTSELWQWTKPDGSLGQGVLYKPENFDQKRKYPLIIYYYERKSGQVHQYPTPAFPFSTHIEIAWFVSHGYLVFTPDLIYTKGKMVESVCSNIISAAKSLALLTYVDGKKMGISGFSWGGHQTYWLLSQTTLFAAAATGGGMSDPISSALQISNVRGRIEDDVMERRETIMGASIWKSNKQWLETSPLLRANKVTTPVIILHNYGDKEWQQGVQFFMALRRLNKKVWLLQYDRGSHGLYDQHDIEDFTVRITQFFDHFLKGAPEPEWMSEGVPAKMKGIHLGYERGE